MRARSELAASPAGLIVRIAGASRRIAAGSVVEVLREARIIRAPGAVAAVRGIVNHRGRILTVADAAVALGVGTAAGTIEVVVVEYQDRRFGLAVESVVELAAEARTGFADIDLERIAAAIFA